ncbi:MAG TPA: DUF6176 family protein [Gemmatimonadaceae bacterium]|nr:DUF6176 family protein [Gemmatimonadaceae bacterium]
MLRTWIHRIKPEQEWRLRTWLTELNARAGEVRESLAGAGVRAEQAFVVSTASGPLLVYVSDAEDQRRAALAFAESSVPVDVEHRRVLEECIEETLYDAPLYDVVV